MMGISEASWITAHFTNEVTEALGTLSGERQALTWGPSELQPSASTAQQADLQAPFHVLR